MARPLGTPGNEYGQSFCVVNSRTLSGDVFHTFGTKCALQGIVLVRGKTVTLTRSCH